MSLASIFATGDDASDAAADRRSAPLWLAIVALTLFLPGFVGLPPTDRDESRFAQATKQMIETGDYVSIRFQDEARNQKPVGIYWLQAAAVRTGQALGVPHALTTIWLYRIPSLLGAVGTVLLTFWAGSLFLSFRAAMLSALLLAATVLLGVEARLATTDAALTATVVAAMGAMARAYVPRKYEGAVVSFSAASSVSSSGSWANAFIFWTAIGVGVLLKGPITPMIPALAAVVLSVKDRSAAWLLRLRPVPGLCWVLLIVAPWLVLITLRTQGAFLHDSLGGDMLAKAAGAKESHGAPPGTYFVAFWLTAWPMAPFAALAVPFVLRARTQPQTAFLLAWFLPAWILFELVPTKLPHYVLPLYPAIALLIGLALDAGEVAAVSRWRKLFLLWVPVFAALAVGAAAGLALWSRLTPALPALVGFPLLIWRILVFLRRGSADAPGRIGESILISLLFYLTIWSGFLASPIVQNLLLTPQLEAARDDALRLTACPAMGAATTRYREPSLVFLEGTDLRMTDAKGAADFLAGDHCRIVFVSQEDEKAFAQALPNSAGAPNFRRVRGFNPSRGRSSVVDVWSRGK